MLKLPNTVVSYLEKLELELKQQVGVSPEDAQSDAREHLCREHQELCKQDSDCSHDAVLEHLIENFGEPTEVASQYEGSGKVNFLNIPGHAPGWRICCIRCGRSAPAARLGITRIGAISHHKYTVGWCHTCGFFRCLRLQKDLDKPTITQQLGVSTTPQQLRATEHRPWTTIAVIVLTVLGVLGIAQLAGFFATTPADAIFEDLPAGWTLSSSSTISNRQVAAISRKFGVEIQQLSNSRLKDGAGELQVNISRCSSDRDAAKLHRKFAALHVNPRDCIRNGTTVYELVPRGGDARRLYAEARYRLGMQPKTVKYRVQFDAASIIEGDPMAWNQLFNLFLEQAAEGNAEAQIKKLSKSFEFGDTIVLRKLGPGGQTSQWSFHPKPIERKSSLGGDAWEVKFGDLARRANVPFAKIEGMITSTTFAGIKSDRASDTSLLAPTAFWPVADSSIQELATEIVDGATTEQTKVQALLKWFGDAKNIQFKGETGSRYGVRKVVAQKFGHCWDYSDVFVTLCRAKEIPCRLIMGWLHGSEGHVWCEVLLDGEWRQFDPTTGIGCGSDYIPLVVSETGKIPLLYVSEVTTQVAQ